jgi:hypothetical protein
MSRLINACHLQSRNWISSTITLALLGFLPLQLIAITLTGQPSAALTRVGTVCHRTSVILAFAVTIYFIRDQRARLFILIAFPAFFVLSAFDPLRFFYLSFLMALAFVCGMALERFHPRFLRVFIVAVSVVSLVIMVLQVVGWPDWINNLAMHGTPEQMAKGLQRTLFAQLHQLTALSWQTRPAGIFGSNQFNSVFFFAMFAISITAPRPQAKWLIPLSAMYAIVLLSKGAIFGSAVISIVMALWYRDEYVARCGFYLGAILVCYFVYLILFPGMVAIYLSPYVIYVSILARAFDLLDAIGFADLIALFIKQTSESSRIVEAITDIKNAYIAAATENATISPNYSSLGSLTLYSEMARNPLRSIALVGVISVIGWWLNRRRRIPALTPFQMSMVLGAAVISVVTPPALLSVFWIFLGFGTLPIFSTAIVDDSGASPASR